MKRFLADLSFAAAGVLGWLLVLPFRLRLTTFASKDGAGPRGAKVAVIPGGDSAGSHPLPTAPAFAAAYGDEPLAVWQAEDR